MNETTTLLRAVAEVKVPAWMHDIAAGDPAMAVAWIGRPDCPADVLVKMLANVSDTTYSQANTTRYVWAVLLVRGIDVDELDANALPDVVTAAFDAVRERRALTWDDVAAQYASVDPSRVAFHEHWARRQLDEDYAEAEALVKAVTGAKVSMSRLERLASRRWLPECAFSVLLGRLVELGRTDRLRRAYLTILNRSRFATLDLSGLCAHDGACGHGVGGCVLDQLAGYPADFTGMPPVWAAAWLAALSNDQAAKLVAQMQHTGATFAEAGEVAEAVLGAA